jgi:hypothetical protein
MVRGRFVLTPPARQRGRKTVSVRQTRHQFCLPDMEVRVPILTTSVK